MTETVRTAALRAIDPGLEPHVSVRTTGHRVIERLRLVDLATPVASRLVDGPEQDPSPLVRTAAAAALGELGGADALEALRRAALRDPSPEVRAAAARELGDLRDRAPGTSDVLIRALRDEAGAVRLNARRALRQIHGADLGLDPLTWSAWLDRRAAGARPAPLEPDVDDAPSPYEPPPYDGPADGDWDDEGEAPLDEVTPR
ncbi:MAG: HEAT repeat domain-containing protein [Planctomycetes bacterium]|nr:HEAT repeat domain-containing protein [Planctomycetota bacterium]